MANMHDPMAHGDGFNGVFPVVADLSMNATPGLSKLRDLHVKVILRYFALQEQWEGKVIHKPEADAILDGGFSLAMTYQYHSGNIDSFKPSKVAAAVQAAVDGANEIGQPKGSAIYFGVDEGWTSNADVGQVVSYFKAVNEAVHNNHQDRFVTGVYGSGLMCRKLKEAGYAKFFWIAGLSDDWPERPQFVKSGLWNMYQNVLEVPVGSIKVDTNVINPNAAVIGSFHRPSPGAPAVVDGPIDNRAVLNVQRFIKGNGNVLRDQPGGTVIKSLAASKMVTKIEEVGDQALIDVPRQIPTGHGNDKVADWQRGYCPKAALVPIDQDPT